MGESSVEKKRGKRQYVKLKSFKRISTYLIHDVKLGFGEASFPIQHDLNNTTCLYLYIEFGRKIGSLPDFLNE